MSDPLAVRLRSELSTVTEQLQAAKLIDSLVDENTELQAVIEQLHGNLAAARRYVHAYTENEANHPQARDNANALIHQIDTTISRL